MPIDCEGAPRDLGFDQGRVMMEGVDAELARILRSRPVDPGAVRVARDLDRHFPQLSERTVGLARGAGVDRRALVLALARAAREPGFLFRPARALALRAPRALLAGRFDLSTDRCSVPVLRRSLPQGVLPSAELTLPWLATSLGGVNAAGLAVLLAPPAPSVTATVRADTPSEAPALLLVQQCLERFERVQAAVDWCLVRPSGGAAAILLADATGALLRVDLDGDQRCVTQPEAVPAEGLAEDPSRLPALLSDAGSEQPGSLDHRAWILLDPSEREVAVVLDPEGLGPARVERARPGGD